MFILLSPVSFGIFDRLDMLIRSISSEMVPWEYAECEYTEVSHILAKHYTYPELFAFGLDDFSAVPRNRLFWKRE